MLKLHRYYKQKIHIGDNIIVEVFVGANPKEECYVGISAPDEIQILRSEIVGKYKKKGEINDCSKKSGELP